MSALTSGVARQLWKALMDNATGLIADAHLLLEAGSRARGRALAVLAQEELGKALWIYDEFAAAWSEANEAARTVERLDKHGRNHIQKFLEAAVYGDELAMFWGDYSSIDHEADWTVAQVQERHRQRLEEAKAAAQAANLQKQAGFYVDFDSDGRISSPTTIETGDIDRELQTAAQVIEMLLIRDHTRMKHETSTAAYDSTHPQQFRLLPISHPEDWAAAPAEFRENPPEIQAGDDDNR